MFINYKRYLHKIYSNNLKNKDIFFLFKNKNLNYEENLIRLKKSKTRDLTSMSLNKNIFKINLMNSIFASLNSLAIAKIGIRHYYLKRNLDYRIWSNNNFILMKFYSKVYLNSQLDKLKSLNYGQNTNLYVFNIKRTVNLISNILKIKTILKISS